MRPAPPSHAPCPRLSWTAGGSDGHSFRWPDEDPTPASLRARLCRAWQGLRRPAGTTPALTRSSARRRLRLRELLRTRPLPLALALAVGLGPLAWALHGIDGWGSLRVDPSSVPGIAPAGSQAPQQENLSSADVASGLRHTSPGAAGPGAAASSASPAHEPQWGEPLPAYRHLFGETPESAGPALPPGTARRTSGSVVLASEYYAARGSPPPLPGGGEGRASVGTAAEAPVPPRAEPRPLGLARAAELLGLSAEVALDDRAAPPPAGSRAWTLTEAVERALARSPEVRDARERLDAFRQAVRSARPSPWVAFGRRSPPADEGIGPAGAPIVPDADHAIALTSAATLVWRETAADEAAQVAQSVLQTLQARVALQMAADYERQLRHLLALATARHSRDPAALAERSRLRLRAAQSRASLVDARVVFEASRDDLAARIGEAPAALALDLPPAWRAPADLRSALDDARQRNPDWVASRSDVAGLAFAAWRATRRPSPNAAGTPSWRFDDGGPALRRVPVSFAGSPGDRRDPPAAADLRIRRELRQAYQALQAVDGQQLLHREGLATQRRALGAARTRWLAGERPLDELLEAYRLQHERRTELAALLFAEARLHVRIAQLAGYLPPTAAGADLGR